MMNKWCCTVLAAFAVLASYMPNLQADTTVFEDGFFFITAPAEFEDVVVGQGAVVTFLDGVVITGDLEVEDGGFVSVNGCLIEGDVQANWAAIVDLLGVDVGGDVSIKRTGGDPVLGLLPLISIINCDICGDVKIINNNVNSITVTGNQIGGKLQVRANKTKFSTISNNQTNAGRCR